MSGAAAAAAGAAAAAVPRLTVSASPSAVYGVWEAELSVGVTDSAQAIVSGGVAPFSYSWTRMSGDAGLNVSPQPTAQLVQWTFIGSTSRVAVWRVTVTDALNNQATADVTVTAN